MRHPGQTLGVLYVLVALIPACGPIEEAQQDTPPPPIVYEQPVVKPPDPALSFQTSTDTVITTNTPPAIQPADSSLPAEIRFMIQIGAYKDPQNASKIQTLARERYRLPVFNDYNSSVAMYQIRIGFFESREAAYKFMQKMVSNFPNDYKDAWVVQLAR
ncbi:MAG: SPOR domain-containing protein [Bacteroidota bacterium]